MYLFLKKHGIDWFILAIFACIFCAQICPVIGIDREPISLGDVAMCGVSLIFFLYGLKLSPQKFKAGLSNVRLHFTVHLMTFLAFPLLILLAFCFLSVSQNNPYYYLLLGVFFLAALPSTVSSSVVMVGIAKGNVPAAIFNASISSLIGVFLTPLWMGLFVDASNGGYAFGETVLKLIFQVLVPVALGLALNSTILGKFAQKHSAVLRYFDQSVILLIIYTSFCQMFYDKMFSSYSFLSLVILSAVLVLLFFVMYFIIYIAARLMKFDRADTITALFCGSKKSLMHGTVMAKVIFANPAVAGAVLLPAMIYHALQLIIVSAIAKRFEQKYKPFDTKE